MDRSRNRSLGLHFMHNRLWFGRVLFRRLGLRDFRLPIRRRRVGWLGKIRRRRRRPFGHGKLRLARRRTPSPENSLVSPASPPRPRPRRRQRPRPRRPPSPSSRGASEPSFSSAPVDRRVQVAANFGEGFQSLVGGLRRVGIDRAGVAIETAAAARRRRRRRRFSASPRSSESSPSPASTSTSVSASPSISCRNQPRIRPRRSAHSSIGRRGSKRRIGSPTGPAAGSPRSIA